MSDSLLPHGLQPTRFLHPWDFPGKSTGVGCHCLLRYPGLAGLRFSCTLIRITWSSFRSQYPDHIQTIEAEFPGVRSRHYYFKVPQLFSTCSQGREPPPQSNQSSKRRSFSCLLVTGMLGSERKCKTTAPTPPYPTPTKNTKPTLLDRNGLHLNPWPFSSLEIGSHLSLLGKNADSSPVSYFSFLAALGHYGCVQAFSSCSVRASHYSGFSCGAWALGARASVVAACRVSSGSTLA